MGVCQYSYQIPQYLIVQHMVCIVVVLSAMIVLLKYTVIQRMVALILEHFLKNRTTQMANMLQVHLIFHFVTIVIKIIRALIIHVLKLGYFIGMKARSLLPA
jgi:hypothetical protein